MSGMRQLSELEMWNLRLGRNNTDQQGTSAPTSVKENAAPQRADKKLPDTEDESSDSSVEDEATRKKKEAFMAQLGLYPTRTRPTVTPALRPNVKKAKQEKKTAKK